MGRDAPRRAHAIEANFLAASEEAERQREQDELENERRLREAAEIAREAERKQGRSRTANEEQTEATRRLRRRLWSLIGAMAATVLVACVAFREWNKAIAEAERADQRTRVAKAGQFAAESANSLPTHPQRSLLLATEAILATRQHREPSSRSPRQPSSCPRIDRGHINFSRGSAFRSFDITADGHRIVAISTSGSLHLIHLDGFNVRSVELLGQAAPMGQVLVSPDGRWLVTYQGNDKAVSLWDLNQPESHPDILSNDNPQFTAFHPDSHRLILGTREIDRDTNKKAARIRIFALDKGDRRPENLQGSAGGTTWGMSSDGRWLATADNTGKISIWNLDQPAERLLVVHELAGGTPILVFHPDGQRLVIAESIFKDASISSSIRILHHGRTGEKPITVYNSSNTLQNIVVYQNGNRIVATELVSKEDQLNICILNIDNKKIEKIPIPVTSTASFISYLLPCCEGRRLVVGMHDTFGTKSAITAVRVFDTASPGEKPKIPSPGWRKPQILRGHDEHITHLSLFRDRYILSCSMDKSIRVYDLERNSYPLAELRGHGTIATSSIDTLGQTSPVIHSIKSLAIHPHGERIATVDVTGTARLWNLDHPGAALATWASQGTNRIALAFHPDGRRLIVGLNERASKDRHSGVIQVLDLERSGLEPQIVHRFEGVEVSSILVHPDGRHLIVKTLESTPKVQLVNAQNPEAPSVVLASTGDSIFGSDLLAIHPDKKRIIVTVVIDRGGGYRRQAIHIIDPFHHDARPMVIGEVEGEFDELTIGADGTYVVGTTRQRVEGEQRVSSFIHVWNLKRPAGASRVIRVDDAIRVLALHPDNSRLAASSSKGSIYLWDLERLDNQPRVFRGDNPIYSLAFEPRTGRLVTGEDDGTVRLWDIDGDRIEAVVLHGHTARVSLVEFLPDGRTLVTGGGDATVRFWNLDVDSLIDIASKRAGRNLSRDEWQHYFAEEEYRKTFSGLPKGDD